MEIAALWFSTIRLVPSCLPKPRRVPRFHLCHSPNRFSQTSFWSFLETGSVHPPGGSVWPTSWKTNTLSHQRGRKCSSTEHSPAAVTSSRSSAFPLILFLSHNFHFARKHFTNQCAISTNCRKEQSLDNQDEHRQRSKRTEKCPHQAGPRPW